jgi:histidinol-phosphate aminotransferase
MQCVRGPAPHLADLAPYDPQSLPARVCLSANESAYGLPPSALDALAQALDAQLLRRYPEPLADGLRARLGAAVGLGPERVLLGNGGDELLLDILLAYGGPNRSLLIAPPTFSAYGMDARLTATTLVELPRTESAPAPATPTGAAPTAAPAPLATFALSEDALLARVAQTDPDLVILASPNNPTGEALDAGFVSRLLDSSDALIVIDQAYVEFADARFDLSGMLDAHANLAILRTFSKAYALAGARLGYLLASETVIAELCKVRQPYSVDSLSVLVAMAALDVADEIAIQIRATVSERSRVTRALSLMDGLVPLDSEANFFLFRIAKARVIWRRLYEDYGILLRDLSSTPGLENCLRLSVGTPQENDEFLEALASLYATEG